MAIKTGIGIGAAQIFDNRGIMNTYMKIIQERKKEDARYQAELADLISKVDTKGISNADKPEVLKMYGEIKDLYGKASSVKSRQDRALLRSQISKSISDLNEYAANSADFIKRYDSLAKDMAKNPWAYDVQKLEQFKKLKDLPLTQLGDMSSLDPFEYQRMPDMKSRDEVFNRVNKQGENFAKGSYKSLSGGREQYVKVLGDDKINELIDVNLQSNPEYRYLAIKNWSEANPGQPLDINKVRANEVLVYKTQYNPEYASAPTRIPKEKGEKSEDEKLTYRQQLITGLVNKDERAKEELLANLPSGAKVTYGVSRAIPGKSKGGYSFMKLFIPGESTEDGIEINETIPLQAGQPVQRINYFINRYSPEKVSPSKVGITGGKPRGEKFEIENKPAKPALQIKESDVAIKAKAAGYTTSEYKKLLQQRGVKIVK